MHQLTIATQQHTQLVDISQKVADLVTAHDFQHGLVYLFCPHTTAGLTFNENWDPDVRSDILLTVDGHIAPEDSRHQHAEGNSTAHIKASLFGSTAFVFVEQGRVKLGRWQGIYLAEFDGPRQRTLWVAFGATVTMPTPEG